MVSKILTVMNADGLHARPAAVFVNGMARFESQVILRYHGVKINGKSILDILASGICCGAEIEIHCEGNDEGAALETAVGLIESGCGE